MQIRPVYLYEARRRTPCARTIREDQIKELILKAYDGNYRCYGGRKIWLSSRALVMTWLGARSNG